MQKEFRIRAAEVRAAADGEKPAIEGYAAMFNQPTELFRGDGYVVSEVIRPGAFKRSLGAGADVRCFFNHDDNQVLGRSKSGTLAVTEDAKGLFFRCELPDTQAGRDTREMVKRGDVDGCSFSFVAMKQNRAEVTDTKTGDVTITRELLDCEIDGCDVGPVTFPAYDSTSVEARSKMLFPAGVPDELKPEKRDGTGDQPAADQVDAAAAEWRDRAEMRVALAERE